MNLKFKDKIEIVIFFNNLMDEDGNVVSELACLTFNIKKRLLMFWILFYPFKTDIKLINSYYVILYVGP
jgi:hypothetical protein